MVFKEKDSKTIRECNIPNLPNILALSVGA
jgi:hypothetical protein